MVDWHLACISTSFSCGYCTTGAKKLKTTFPSGSEVEGIYLLLQGFRWSNLGSSFFLGKKKIFLIIQIWIDNTRKKYRGTWKFLFLICKKWKWKWSRVQLFVTPWTVAYQAPPSMEFSRQEYWSGLPFSSPGDLPDPGIEPWSSAFQAGTLPSEPPG